jgi:beta-glucosidase
MGALPRFPRAFRFGVATSAFQIEGATMADGRGESTWDRFCATPGKVLNGDTGAVACDHYRRYEDDLDLIAGLGLDSYRFSIAWPRVVPTGTGAVNQRGLDYYRRLLEAMRERGLRPLATLYHWDLPQALEELGGWVNRDTAFRFAEYAAVVFESLGDLVDDWITQNEPWVTAVEGYAQGKKAPGLTDWPASLAAAHHLLLSHGLAVQAFDAVRPRNGRIGITLNLSPMLPASESDVDADAARRADGFHNRWYLDPVLLGAYPEDMLTFYASRGVDLRFIAAGDGAVIGAPTDFLGVNYYSVGRIADAPAANFLGLEFRPATSAVTAMGWEIAPEHLEHLLVRLDADYGQPRILITENGAAFDDALLNGQVYDVDRIRFLEEHLAAIARAVAAGVDVEAYYLWSLLDNFEWESGYRPRFGIVHVDYATQRRTPKQSALWYRDFVCAQRVAERAA